MCHRYPQLPHFMLTHICTIYTKKKRLEGEWVKEETSTFLAGPRTTLRISIALVSFLGTPAIKLHTRRWKWTERPAVAGQNMPNLALQREDRPLLQIYCYTITWWSVFHKYHVIEIHDGVCQWYNVIQIHDGVCVTDIMFHKYMIRCSSQI